LEWSFVSNKIYGPGFTGTVPFLRFVDISTRVDWIEHVQKTNFRKYEKGKTFHNINKDVLGDGIFNQDGHKWYLQRKVTSKIFTAQNFTSIITPAIHKDLEALTALLDHHAQSGTTFDLQDVFFRFTLQSFARIAFESSFFPLFLFHFLWGEGGSKFGIDLKTLGIDSPVIPFAEDRDDEGNPLTPSQLKDAVVNLLIAGRDTTAQALTWSFFRLIKSPSLQAPLIKEAETVLPSFKLPEMDDLKMLKVAQSVVFETLRLHPSIPKNLKQCVEDDQLPGGPRIMKGDFVRWGDWIMGRQPHIWGDDCLEFKPSRWIDEQGNVKNESQWKFHAFNGQPRYCLGFRLATLEMVTILTHLIQRYDLSFAPGWWDNVDKANGIMPHDDDTPLYGASLSLPMKDPFLVRCVLK
ncbi:cytochrome P450, partial [Meredithblackwellia eburnea MCA 4105]